MITSDDISRQVTTAIEASGDQAHDIDIDGIVDEIIAAHGRVDIDTLDAAVFWSTVARHDATQA